MTHSARKPVIAGNWKMFKTPAEADVFTRSLHDQVKKIPSENTPEMVICPPFTALSAVVSAVEKLKAPFVVAAQTMESKDSGAFTGEISPLMLKDIGVNWVVLGHSERRQYYNESNQSVNEKTKAALAHGLTPIVCVGETLSEREAGVTDERIQTQVEEALKDIDPSDYPKIVLAYEPVWAIGTGKVCESDEANRVCGLIRKTLAKQGDADKTRILYGGSVKPENIKEIMAGNDIDGALVGGASLEPESFFKIITGSLLVNA